MHFNRRSHIKCDSYAIHIIIFYKRNRQTYNTGTGNKTGRKG